MLDSLRPAATRLPTSGIIEVFAYGRTRPGLIPLWAGEGDLPTPSFICEAATKALTAGETFYTYQAGLPSLRDSLARYHRRHYDRSFASDEFFVTGSGMQAIMLALQCVAGADDTIVTPSPAWPNFAGAAVAMGAALRSVPMRLTAGGWQLDCDALFAAVDATTRAIVVNSPSNPTGWTASRDELRAILHFARQRGLWIVADEIYGRFHYAGGVAPSFQDLRQPGDRILFVNTFSKMWAMTGWRIGWLQAPAELGPTIENLVQYNTSGVAPFMQHAATAALEEGESFAISQIERAARGRDIVCNALAPFNSVRFTPPPGAFYLFFAIDGLDDARTAAFRLVDEANIGLAPGTAFGPGGERYFRICFLRSPAPLEEAMHRITHWLQRR
ncbi:MAG: pyridoxal phosphate-dependent aminotransferase [Hyphomicrobiaceae bacterium]